MRGEEEGGEVGCNGWRLIAVSCSGAVIGGLFCDASLNSHREFVCNNFISNRTGFPKWN